VFDAAAAWTADVDVLAFFEGLVLEAELVGCELFFELFEVIVVVLEG
jgi:hypothetical protein